MAIHEENEIPPERRNQVESTNNQSIPGNAILANHTKHIMPSGRLNQL